MSDLVKTILTALRNYIPALLAVISDPRRTIPDRVGSGDDALDAALAFFGITLALSLLLQLPLLGPADDPVAVFGSLPVVRMLMFAIFTACVVLAFRAVGGRGGFIPTLCISLYVNAPAYLVQVTTALMSRGLVARSGAIDLADLQDADTRPAASAALAAADPTTATLLVATGVLGIGIVVAWFLYCWPIYRAQHRVSRARSGVAYAVAFAAYLASLWLGANLMRGLHGDALPAIV
ncbi:YIP1 family protein [uncultured Jannaschia sp.]|uniref:YIP1 family protein n=1 Tax=uncultured Jannaschia sp. TaxID=293347 RepID=UPI002601AE84|nr:YIP1 family protein [uncultured Jannaschia sp.]